MSVLDDIFAIKPDNVARMDRFAASIELFSRQSHLDFLAKEFPVGTRTGAQQAAIEAVVNNYDTIAHRLQEME